jgi:hypothetical protein
MGRISLTRPGPEGPNYWATFKENIASLIIEALLILRQRDDLVKDEFVLNRLLYFCLVEANLQFGLPLPAYDGRNPPHPSDLQKAKREDNRPDIYWTLMDHEASYPDWCRTFALECKRLGRKTSKDWILNEQYVIAGIFRFFLEEKGYGKGCSTGAMAGYVEDMEFDEILCEVNSYLDRNEGSIPPLEVPVDGWQHQGVSSLCHTFSRSYAPSVFLLQHFWVDMKDSPYLPSSSNTEDTSSQQEGLLSNQENDTKRKKRASKTRKPQANTSQMRLPIDSAGSSALECKDSNLEKQEIDS